MGHQVSLLNHADDFDFYLKKKMERRKPRAVSERLATQMSQGSRKLTQMGRLPCVSHNKQGGPCDLKISGLSEWSFISSH